MNLLEASNAPCEKGCIANVGGKCAVARCEGKVQRLSAQANRTPEEAALVYSYAISSFKDYFGEEATP